MRKLSRLKKVAISIIILILLPNIIPIKTAVDSKSLKNKGKYIMVKQAKTTGYDWRIIGDENGAYNRSRGIKLTGKNPIKGYSLGIQMADNTYICYGEFKGSYKSHEDTLDVFEVYEWDILNPIVRQSIREYFMYTPKSYLDIYDLVD